jgi:hypothetical protein
VAPAPDVLSVDPDRTVAAQRPGRSRRRRWPAAGLAAAGAGCVIAGSALLVSGPGPADVGELPAGPVTTAAGAPDTAGGEAPASGLTAPVAGAAQAAPAPGTGGPSTGARPEPAGTVPVRVSLPGLGISAPVVPVGTGPAGAMVIPEPPSTVGWWSPGPLAGSAAGPAVLAGHVDSRTGGLGAFAALRDAQVGAAVVVRGADGRELRYAVVARREYLKAELPTALFTGGPPGLVLITCGGRFDPATGHYEDNVVVHAVPVG